MWTDLSIILSQSTRLTARQTDGHIDGILIARPRLHSTQRGKNQPVTALLIHIVIILNAELKFLPSTISEILGGAEILKEGHVTLK